MAAFMMRIAEYSAKHGSSLELHSRVTEKELAENERKKQERKEMFERQAVPGLRNVSSGKIQADGLTKAERIKLQLQGIRTGKD